MPALLPGCITITKIHNLSFLIDHELNSGPSVSESNNFNNLATLEIPKPARLTVIQAGKFGMTIVTQSVYGGGSISLFYVA